MSKVSPPHNIETLLRTYFHGKDENRPHLLSSVFDASARLQVVNRVDTIAFPSLTEGCDAIADVFARRFGQTFENVYSFYMSRPQAAASEFSCDWLVGMSEKEGGSVRVGCGRYDWEFGAEPPHRVGSLVITIEAMQVLPPTALDSVLAWLRQLNYPWSSAAAVLKAAPEMEELGPVLRYLGGKENRA